MGSDLRIFSGNSNPALAGGIADALGTELGAIEFVRFSNENIKVKICENVRGCDVFIIQTSCPPVNEYLMELLIALDALKYASAGRITAVLPYFPYALSDSKDEPRISVASRLVADLLTEAGADRILTMTLHSPQIVGFFRVPVDQLSGVPAICDHYSNLDLSNCVAAAPDISRAKVTEGYARRLGIPLVVIDRRHTKSGEARVHGVIGDVESKDAILFDDEIVTGESMLSGAVALRERGAETVFAGCVHGTLVDHAHERVTEGSELDGLAVTDTIPPKRHESEGSKLAICSVATQFAGAIKAIHDETSISTLFN